MKTIILSAVAIVLTVSVFATREALDDYCRMEARRLYWRGVRSLTIDDDGGYVIEMKDGKRFTGEVRKGRR